MKAVEHVFQFFCTVLADRRGLLGALAGGRGLDRVDERAAADRKDLPVQKSPATNPALQDYLLFQGLALHACKRILETSCCLSFLFSLSFVVFFFLDTC